MVIFSWMQVMVMEKNSMGSRISWRCFTDFFSGIFSGFPIPVLNYSGVEEKFSFCPIFFVSGFDSKIASSA